MRRASVLWIVVVIGVGGALAIRVSRQSILDVVKPAATQPAGTPLPPQRDYTADPIVHPDEVANGPRSIVSLAPSITETCCALGLLDRLVGRTAYDVSPPAVRKVPVVGALVDPNLELITSLKPEVIFITKTSPRLRDPFTSLGLPFEEIGDDSFEGIFFSIERVGALTHRPKTAAALIERLRDDLASISAAAQTRHAKRVLIVLDELPVPPASIFVAGPGLFLTRLLNRTGHVNAAEPVVHAMSGELTLEQIVTLNPDVILEVCDEPSPRRTAQLYESWSRVGPIRAIQDRAVRLYGTRANLVSSPRINVVYYELAQALADWR